MYRQERNRTGFLIEVNGVVQGVGFRPFVHKLVSELFLCGWVRNTSQGAELCLEGNREALLDFAGRIKSEAPELARIESVSITEYGDLKGFSSFRIIASDGQERVDTLVSPDICTCDDCLRELFDPEDRRYRFPFINCTNCGPRFTIIRDLPYDRNRTSMDRFPMCQDCSAEYHDITNRRYHAQPDCCPACGPVLEFLDSLGQPVEGDPIRSAIELLKGGGIVAVKGLGGFHLACRADDPKLIRELRVRKRRDAKPFALMCSDLEAAREFCRIKDREGRLLLSKERPIVLLEKKVPDSYQDISENKRIGIMLPYAPVHFLLMHETIRALVMTSANLSDDPIIRDNEEALKSLKGIADGFLLHNRDILTRCDDSVMWPWGGGYFARRSRGFTPLPIAIDGDGPEILACGAEQKATFSVGKRNHVFPSQHIGDLKNIASFEHYEEQIAYFERLFSIHPEALACDLHPDYLSSVYACERAEKEKIPLIKVQHHHAHMASCMADNRLDGWVIGITWDGTGLGTDGTSWGGEILTGGYDGFERQGSLLPFAMPGGDRAAKEIKRLAWSLLRTAGVPQADIEAVLGQNSSYKMWEYAIKNKLNAPVTSGIGRLFDGVSALIGICSEALYEGQGAVLLEACASESCEERYTIEYVCDECVLFDHRPMIRELVRDLKAGLPNNIMAAKFMNTLIEMAIQQCVFISKRTGLDRVVLSGGSFQNMYLLERISGGLEKAGLHCFTHHRVAANDEGISLGQYMIARHKLCKD